MSVSNEPGRGGLGPIATAAVPGTVGAVTLPFTAGDTTLSIVAIVAIAVGVLALLSSLAVRVARHIAR